MSQRVFPDAFLPRAEAPARKTANYRGFKGWFRPGWKAFKERIDAVSEGVIRQHLVEILSQFGATGEEDLISGVSKKLGFQRCVPKIKRRIGEVIRMLVGEGRLTETAPNQRLTLVL